MVRHAYFWVAAILSVFAAGSCGRDRCPLAPERWFAEPRYYNYFHIVELEDDGSGMMTEVDNMAVWELPFGYERQPGALIFRYADNPNPRRVEYRIDEGSFVIIMPAPPVVDGKPTKRLYRCRLRFEEDPFPGDSGRPRDYYGCLVKGEH